MAPCVYVFYYHIILLIIGIYRTIYPFYDSISFPRSSVHYIASSVCAQQYQAAFAYSVRVVIPREERIYPGQGAYATTNNDRFVYIALEVADSKSNIGGRTPDSQFSHLRRLGPQAHRCNKNALHHHHRRQRIVGSGLLQESWCHTASIKKAISQLTVFCNNNCQCTSTSQALPGFRALLAVL